MFVNTYQEPLVIISEQATKKVNFFYCLYLMSNGTNAKLMKSQNLIN